MLHNKAMNTPNTTSTFKISDNDRNYKPEYITTIVPTPEYELFLCGQGINFRDLDGNQIKDALRSGRAEIIWQES